MHRLLIRLIAAALGLSLAGLSACAVNPVTGERDFVLMSEDQEIAIGRKTHPDVLQAYGEYPDGALQSYVQEVGAKLAARSHRSNLVYRFTVLDSREVNAFALPGGYIYITRGLLAYLNSEAELAAVLGHEIGHVTARHAVRQHSAAAATGVVGIIIAAGTGVEGTQDLANVLGTAIVRGYGREHELDADRLGAEYLARAGYDPTAMLDVIGVLKDQESFEIQRAREEEREPRVYHGLFSTHPDNDKRLQEVVGRANSLRTATAVRVNREGFLRRLEGLVFGDSEREGIRRGSSFYHKELGFALHFPKGWRIDNRPDRLLAQPASADALLQMTAMDINRRIPPRQFLLTRLKLDDLSHGEAIRHLGLQGYTAIADARTPFGVRPTRFVVLYFKDKAYVFAGAAKDRNQPFVYDRAFLDAARSFHPLRPEEQRLATALRIHLLRAALGTRFAALAQGSRIPNHPEAQLRLLNHYYPEGEPDPGALIKIVH